MMSHTMENYFSMENADCQKFMAEGLLRTMIKNGPVALAQPDNYEARANLMWAGTHAINGVVGDGCSPAWCVHPMEHELSAFYDITHGEGLAILTPAWMEHILNDDTLPMLSLIHILTQLLKKRLQCSDILLAIADVHSTICAMRAWKRLQRY